jgi:hypothetical protein
MYATQPHVSSPQVHLKNPELWKSMKPVIEFFKFSLQKSYTPLCILSYLLALSVVK